MFGKEPNGIENLENIAIMAFAALIGFNLGDFLIWLGASEEIGQAVGVSVFVVLAFFGLGYFLYAHFLRDNPHIDPRKAKDCRDKDDPNHH